MSDTVFRSKVESAPVAEQKAPADKSVPIGTSTVEPPFTEYEKENHHPYLVDHYELGSLWNQGDMYSDAFVPEVETINTYLTHMIEKGEINNTLESVKNELKRIEKINNIRPDQRKAMRLGIVAEYVKFILKSEDIKRDSGKYGLV